MNVLLISQCDKRALTETRRLLDQFAERRGDTTWQTPITKDGLGTLRKLLRKTARKNTAVACHWIRGADHSELLWVVGDRSRFNANGAVPTNTTRRDVLRRKDESDWHTGDLICLLADLSGLLHDLGKAMDAFQKRLQGLLSGRNLVRHEWVSLRLFEAFVGTDDDATWLARLASPTVEDDARWLLNLRRDGLDEHLDSAFKTLKNAPVAQALAWLVVTHHRLPELPNRADFQMSSLRGLLSQLQPDWNERAFNGADRIALEPYWHFSDGLPVTTKAWRQRASRIAKRLLSTVQRSSASQLSELLLNNPFVMHLARLSLMLGDHHYSSLEGPRHSERVGVIPGNRLLANTCRKDGSPNQPLDEHLVGVAQHGGEIARFLPNFAHHLPRLGHHRRLKQRTQNERFRWQDKSSDLAVAMREPSQQRGAFIVNMASTGCGKTLANARVMYALADPTIGMRCSFAMGLRTLTLQTGSAFRSLLELTADDLAVRVGGSASRALFEHYEAQAEATGSASQQALIDEDAHVLFEGQTEQHPLLRRAVADPQVRALLLAPILVCTIDHLTPATESQRGGRQIAPMLRLLSGDLVLDEPDDFDLSDLPALTRLVHWAGLLGARVLLSSATLPPALVQGLFEAYRNGRQHFQRNCGSRLGSDMTSQEICCAWIDEFHQVAQECGDATDFEQAHLGFARRREVDLSLLATEPRRRAALLTLGGLGGLPKGDLPAIAEVVAPQMLAAAQDLHRRHHSVDPRTGKRVSFGLVRMANIEPLYEVALALFKQEVPANVRVHLCVYHSRHPLLVRSFIEEHLDTVLARHDPNLVFEIPEIRRRLDGSRENEQLFIVLGSPVTEVGRDHDYDWAVVEPSSMRSLIQLGGRIRRHRQGSADTPNILVFNTNLRHHREPGKAAFCKPGFETNFAPFHLESHDLQQLMQPADYEVVDARPRIVSPTLTALRPQRQLVDLEHARMNDTMLGQSKSALPGVKSGRARAPAGAVRLTLNASTWWQQPPQDALLTALLPQQQPFREEALPRDVALLLLPDEDGESEVLHQVLGGGRSGPAIYVEVDRSQCLHLPDSAVIGARIEAWGVTNYIASLRKLATELDLPLGDCARRFGIATVRPNDNGWRYHPALGYALRR